MLVVVFGRNRAQAWWRWRWPTRPVTGRGATRAPGQRDGRLRRPTAASTKPSWAPVPSIALRRASAATSTSPSTAPSSSRAARRPAGAADKVHEPRAVHVAVLASAAACQTRSTALRLHGGGRLRGRGGVGFGGLLPEGRARCDAPLAAFGHGVALRGHARPRVIALPGGHGAFWAALDGAGFGTD